MAQRATTIRRNLLVPHLAAAVLAGLAGTASAQQAEPLASYFGFDAQRIIVVDDGCGPAVHGDFNGDDLPDVAVVNNAKSRIEVHYLRATERTPAEIQRDLRANELPPNAWYDRVNVSVTHRIGSLLATDADGDGRLDLVYAGIDPAELVVLGQREPGEFSVVSRRRIRGLEAAPTTLEIGDVVGDSGRELLVAVSGAINIVPLSGDGAIGQPTPLGSPAGIRGIFVEDYNGDGRQDVLAVAPQDGSPLRVWLQRQDPATRRGELTRELRFEMPPLREAEPVRLPGEAACAFATIEEPTRRITLYRLSSQDIGSASARQQRDVLAEVVGFPDGRSADRSVQVVDLDGDGLLDLVATNKAGNSIGIYRQRSGAGLTTGVDSPSFREPTIVAAGQWTGDARPEIFVASEAEATVGVCAYDPVAGTTSFPAPIPLRTPGAAPVALEHVTIDGQPAIAVVVRKGRELAVELHQPDQSGRFARVDLTLTGVTQPPRHILAHDADKDGRTDLLLLTPNQPMIMLRGVEGAAPFEVLKREDMRQFGLVSGAGPDNTLAMDVSGDGGAELLIASNNFVRACVYDAQSGWSVVEQINVPDPATQLAGLAMLPTTDDGPATLLASDRAGQRLITLRRDADRWAVAGDVRLLGFPAGPISAGVFTGDGVPGVLAVSDDAFALVRLSGQRPTLETVAAFRSDSEDRLEHEIECGDVNNDGYLDMVVLDAREQMCQIYSVSAARRLLLATEFKVFESRLFFGGQDLYQPSSAVVADLTGDGRDDVMLTVHDRLIIYPQMAR